MDTTLILFFCTFLFFCISTSASKAEDYAKLSDVSKLSEFGLMDLFHENINIKGKRSKDHVRAALHSKTVLDTKLDLEEERLMNALSTGFSMSYIYNAPKTATPSRKKQTTSPVSIVQPIQTKPPTVKPSSIHHSNAPTVHTSKQARPTSSPSSLSLQPKDIPLTALPTSRPSKAPSEGVLHENIYHTSHPTQNPVNIPSDSQVTNDIMLCRKNDESSSISSQSIHVLEIYTYLYVMETTVTPSQDLLDRIDSTVKSDIVLKLCKQGNIRRNLAQNHRFLSFVGVNSTTSATMLQSMSSLIPICIKFEL